MGLLVRPLEIVGDALTSVGRAIGTGLDFVARSLADLFSAITDLAVMIGDFIVTIISYINPLSENFFLKVAFVPSDGFFTEYLASFNDMVNSKFAVIGQLRDTLSAFGTAVSSNVNSDFSIKADLSRYGIGEQEIVNGQALRAYGEKLKFWIGGLMYFICGMWLFRKLTSLLAEGK